MNEITPLQAQTAGSSGTEALPHNIEAEQQLLGAILTNNEIYDRVASVLSEAHFYDPVHARIYEVASARIKKNALASPVTLKAFFEDDPGLQELGGPAYLVRLAGAAVASFAARDYAQMIYDLAVRRNLIDLGRDISEKAARIDNPVETHNSNVVPLRNSHIPSEVGDGTSWCVVAAKLQEQDPAVFNAWFSSLIPSELDTGILTLTAPSRFAAHFIRTNHLNRILAAVLSADRSIRDVEIVSATD